MASTNNFIISMTNYYNDMKRDIINDIMKKTQTKENWTKEELNVYLNEELTNIKSNKNALVLKILLIAITINFINIIVNTSCF